MQVPLQGHVPQYALASAQHRAIGSVVHYHHIRTVMAPNIISIKRRILVLLKGGSVADLETKASSIYRLCTTNHIFSLAHPVGLLYRHADHPRFQRPYCHPFPHGIVKHLLQLR